MKMLHRGEKGFTLIELLIVVAILGIIAAVVALNIGGFFGTGKEQAANTEAHQVQTAVIAYMAAGGANATGTVGPSSDITDGVYKVSDYLLNPGLLQADYTVVNGEITGANTTGDSKWSGCTWDTNKGAWNC